MNKSYDEVQTKLEMVVQSAERLQRFITDILEYSRTSVRSLPFESVSFPELLSEIKDQFAKELDANNATLTVESLPTELYVQKTPITQVFQNLIENALKFCAKDRSPVISVKSENLGQFWRFEVEDNGIGIEAKYFDKIIKPFQKLEKSVNATGTGMGLSICQKIIHSHGGNFWINSTPGKGSKFYFTVDAALEKNNEQEATVSLTD